MQVLAKEDLRQRQMSLGAESDTSSLYFSVASHFEDGDKDGDTGSSSANREGGGATGTTAAPVEEGSEAVGGRRRRHSNYAPPPQLLMWLEESPESADTADQPWPFNESVSCMCGFSCIALALYMISLLPSVISRPLPC